VQNGSPPLLAACLEREAHALMCGICGELRFDAAVVQAERVVAMRDRLVHRGPDAAGLYLSPGGAAGLGFRRLKIIDLSEQANQPLPNEDGTVLVVFNGEIYNYETLRRDLISRGHIFRSRSDTEVIVHLYEEHGSQCVDKLDGMFAFAIWDERNQRLVLARDRAGEKPLFYRRDGQHLVFASEIKAFFGSAGPKLEVDTQSIPYYFLYGYVPSPQTFYRGVQQIEPGTVVNVDRDGSVSSRRYWRLEYPDEATSRDHVIDRRDAATTVRALVTSAVRNRLASDVPLGAFLSGGLDSTVIVGVMSQLLAQPVKTFSIGFKDSPDYDETRYARLVADRFKTDHTEFIVEPAAYDLMEKLVWHHDGPFADSSAVPAFIVSQLTREKVTVVLTGDAGDELFAGYDRFSAALFAEHVPPLFRRALERLRTAVPAARTTRHWRSRVRRFAAAAALPLEERITSWVGLFYADVESLMGAGVALNPLDRLKYLDRFRDQLDGLSPLSRLLLLNFNTYLLDDLLVKTDRCTMANSLEARCPFLDTALMEYVAMLPDETKLRRGHTKIILREAFSDLVPPEILRRPKMGFGIPFGAWFRGSLRDALHDTLLSSNARYRDYLSAGYVQSLVKRHDAGVEDLGLSLWALLSFETWLQLMPSWLGEAPRGESAHVSAR